MDDSNFYVGYENGKILEYPPNSKRLFISSTHVDVSCMNILENYIISGYTDGSISIYSRITHLKISGNIIIHDKSSILNMKAVQGKGISGIVSFGDDNALKYSKLTIDSNSATAKTTLLLRDQAIHSICPIIFDIPFAIISNNNTIQMLSTEQYNNIIWEYKNHKNEGNVIAYLSLWKNDGKFSNLLAVAQGTSISLLQIKKKDYVVIGEYEANESINYISWIEDFTLKILKGVSVIELLCTESFMTTAKSKIEPKLGEQKLENKDFIKAPVHVDGVVMDYSYHNCFCVFNNKIAYITTNKLIICQMKGFIQFLNDVSANQSFYNVIKICTKIRRGLIKGLFGLKQNFFYFSKDFQNFINTYVHNQKESCHHHYGCRGRNC